MSDQLTESPSIAATRLLNDVERVLLDVLDEELPRWRVWDTDGNLVAVLRAFVASGGKRLRPEFCVLGYVAADGCHDAEPVVRIAAALGGGAPQQARDTIRAYWMLATSAALPPQPASDGLEGSTLRFRE